MFYVSITHTWGKCFLLTDFVIWRKSSMTWKIQIYLFFCLFSCCVIVIHNVPKNNECWNTLTGIHWRVVNISIQDMMYTWVEAFTTSKIYLVFPVFLFCNRAIKIILLPYDKITYWTPYVIYFQIQAQFDHTFDPNSIIHWNSIPWIVVDCRHFYDNVAVWNLLQLFQVI